MGQKQREVRTRIIRLGNPDQKTYREQKQVLNPDTGKWEFVKTEQDDKKPVSKVKKEADKREKKKKSGIASIDDFLDSDES